MIQASPSCRALLLSSISALGAVIAIGGAVAACKKREFNADARARSVGPESFGPRMPKPTLTLEQCIDELKAASATGKMTKPGLGITEFLYCKDLLVAQFPDDNLSRACVDETLTNPFLTRSGLVKDNSFGYPVNDSSYVASNADKLAIEKALPSFFGLTSDDPEVKKKGEEFFLGLFIKERYADTYAEVTARIDRNNADPNATEKVYVASYRTMNTPDLSSSASDTYRRLAFLTVRKDCSSFVNMVPNDSRAGLQKSAVVSHVVCAPSSLKRVDGQSRQGAWFYSWRTDSGIPSHFVIARQQDANCLRCHSGRSSFTTLDVGGSMPLDEHSTKFMDAIYAKDSRFMKHADFLMTLGEGGDEVQVAMPKHFALQGNLSFDLPNDVVKAAFEESQTQWVCAGDMGGEAGLKEYLRCQSCHGNGGKIAGPLYNARKSMVLSNMARDTHPFGTFHNAKMRINEFHQCLVTNVGPGTPMHRRLRKASLEALCKNVKARGELAWLFGTEPAAPTSLENIK